MAPDDNEVRVERYRQMVSKNLTVRGGTKERLMTLIFDGGATPVGNERTFEPSHIILPGLSGDEVLHSKNPTSMQAKFVSQSHGKWDLNYQDKFIILSYTPKSVGPSIASEFVEGNRRHKR
jgi:hypothetical protein